MARPIVALLTDFGTRDHYAGTMKGVVLALCARGHPRGHHPRDPAARRPDASLELAASFEYFPPGTIFLVVVNPGVGSARRGLVAEVGDYRFVAPDNGVLTAVFRDHKPKRVVELTERRYARPTVSRTFEGRDRFAPAAAWLARGTEPTAMGRPVTTWQTVDLPEPQVESSQIRGEVVLVDRFGNLVATSTGGCSISSGMKATCASPWTVRASTVSSRPMPRRRPAASARCSAVRSISSWR